MLVIKILFYFLLSIVAYILLAKIIRRFWKFPAPSFIGVFLDSRFRRRMMQPSKKLIERSGIKRGMRISIMELGCGPGTFTIDAARKVGKTGKVYALDIQKEMINKLKKKLSISENRDIKNIKLNVASAYKLPYKNNFFDLVYMVTVLPEIPDKQRALKEVSRVLKSNGILAVSELFMDPDYPLKKTTEKWCMKAGFKFFRKSGNFFNYTIQFRKS